MSPEHYNVREYSSSVRGTGNAHELRMDLSVCVCGDGEGVSI